MKNPLESESFLSFLLATSVSLATFVFSKRKRKAEEQSSELENISKALKNYREMLGDLEHRYTSVAQELKESYIIIESLREKIDLLSAQNKHLKTLIPDYHNGKY